MLNLFYNIIEYSYNGRNTMSNKNNNYDNQNNDYQKNPSYNGRVNNQYGYNQ